MILDTLGIGILGTSTDVFHKASEYSKVRSSRSSLEGKPGVRAPAQEGTRECTGLCVFCCAALRFREGLGAYSIVVCSFVLFCAPFPEF